MSNRLNNGLTEVEVFVDSFSMYGGSNGEREGLCAAGIASVPIERDVRMPSFCPYILRCEKATWTMLPKVDCFRKERDVVVHARLRVWAPPSLIGTRLVDRLSMIIDLRPHKRDYKVKFQTDRFTES